MYNHHFDYDENISSKKKYILSAKKGAYSTQKFKPNEISKDILKKLNAAATKKETNSQKKHEKEERIKEYCRMDDFSKLEEPFISHTEWAFIPMKILKYNTPYDLDRDPVFVPIIPYDMFGSSWKIYKEYNNFNESFLISSSLNNELLMDTKWLQRQKEYVYNLSKYDIFTLKGYTHYGDILVNSYLRDVLDHNLVRINNKEFFNSTTYFPVFFQLDNIVSKFVKTNNKLAIESLFNANVGTKVKLYMSPDKTVPSSAKLQVYIDLIINKYKSLPLSTKYILLVSLWNHMHNDTYKNVIQMYYEDLTRIINHSPSITKDIKVYRGVKDDYYLRGSKDGIYRNIGFVSTSLDVEKAQFFQSLDNDNVDKEETCCIKVIQLLKGTKALLMMPISEYGHEKEVLLDHGSLYNIRKPMVLKTFYSKPYEKAIDICQKRTHKIYVSEIVVTN